LSAFCDLSACALDVFCHNFIDAVSLQRTQFTLPGTDAGLLSSSRCSDEVEPACCNHQHYTIEQLLSPLRLPKSEVNVSIANMLLLETLTTDPATRTTERNESMARHKSRIALRRCPISPALHPDQAHYRFQASTNSHTDLPCPRMLIGLLNQTCLTLKIQKHLVRRRAVVRVNSD
jgi:hypothetical protein